VTDLGAFAAATYKRGMTLALASTSLLGCVDAAIGGKGAVNSGSSKNVIGCFTTPEKVVLDLASLETLNPSGLREGLIEAYKTGLVASTELAEMIEADTESLLEGDLPDLARIVTLSAQAKADIVARDFKEGGVRMILNLGHTLGHAVEAWHNYRVSHGLAVGAGLIAALKLSLQRRLIGQSDADRIIGTAKRICGNLPALPPPDTAWEIMEQDKKKTKGKVLFVLLEGVGLPVIMDDICPGELGTVIRDMNGGI
jgi:3-dehydroquinate synthetase